MTSDRTFELLARSGYAARGVVYLLIGGIALFSSLGGGADASSDGALDAISRQPFGQILLVLVGLGFVGHVLWRLAQSLFNADRHRSDPKGYAIRAGLFVSALANSSIAFYALRLAWEGRFASGPESGGEQGATAWLMHQPFGSYLVGMVALGVAAAGAAQIYKGLSGRYKDWLDLPPNARLLNPLCAFGLSARGVVFLIIACFLGYASFTVDPQQAGGMRDALAWVRGLPFGAMLYAVVALGLAAFAIYSLVQARYRRMNTDGPVAKAKRTVAAAG